MKESTHFSPLDTHAGHKSNILPVLTHFPAHRLAIMSIHTEPSARTAASALLNGHGSASIPVSHQIGWKCTGLGSVGTKGQAIFAYKALP